MVDGLGEGLAFALGWVRNPRRVGAIAPASKALAQAMADEVSRLAPDRLLRIIATQTGWLGLEDQILNAPLVIAEGAPARKSRVRR